MSFIDKVGFWGSISSIVGIIIIFLPPFNSPDQEEKEENKSYGDNNVIIRGDGNNVTYDNKKNSNIKDKRINGIREYFGFYAGNNWVYKIGNITTKDGTEREVISSTYKNSILLVNHNYDLSSGIVTVKQEGNEMYSYCATKNKIKVFWYVYNKVHIFRVCDYDQAEIIHQKISKNNYDIDNLEALKAKLLYEFPLKVGNAWWSEADDSNAENIKNNINWYTFYPESVK
jgi:hypothetical protein